MTETNSSQLVRVGIPDVKVQKCIVLNAMDTVWTAKQVILHKVYRELTLDPLNYGIYLPGTAKGNLGKFLIDSQLLSDYALEGIIPKLELRYKRRDYSLTLLTDKAISKVDNRANKRKLLEYITSGNVKKLEKLLTAGVDPNFMTEDGNTPLGLACGRNGNTQCITPLLSGGSHIDFRGKDGLTPMHRAAIGGNSKAINVLLSLGASPNYRDAKGLTPLFQTAIMGDDIASCISLLRFRVTLGVSDRGGWTELHYTAKHGHLEHADLLIRYGIDINAQNLVGNTALHVAASHGKTLLALLLLKRGAQKTVPNYSGQSPSQVSVRCGQHQLATEINAFTDDQIEHISLPPDYHPNAKAENKLYDMKSMSEICPIRLADDELVDTLTGEWDMRNSDSGATLSSLDSTEQPFVLEHPKLTEIRRNSSASATSKEPLFRIQDSGVGDTESVSSIEMGSNNNSAVGTPIGTQKFKGPSFQHLRERLYRARPGCYVVNQDVEPQQPGDLTLLKGMVVEVTYIGKGDYWEGKAGGKGGWFPRLAISEIGDEEFDYATQRVSKTRTLTPALPEGILQFPPTDLSNLPTGDELEPQTSAHKNITYPDAISQEKVISSTLSREVKVVRGSGGYGFAMRGVRATKSMQFHPTPEVPSLQYVGTVEEVGGASVAGLKAGDFIVMVNGINTTYSTHDDVVNIIRRSGGTLVMNVITPVIKQKNVSEQIKSCLTPDQTSPHDSLMTPPPRPRSSVVLNSEKSRSSAEEIPQTMMTLPKRKETVIGGISPGFAWKGKFECGFQGKESRSPIIGSHCISSTLGRSKSFSSTKMNGHARDNWLNSRQRRLATANEGGREGKSVTLSSCVQPSELSDFASHESHDEKEEQQEEESSFAIALKKSKETILRKSTTKSKRANSVVCLPSIPPRTDSFRRQASAEDDGMSILHRELIRANKERSKRLSMKQARITEVPKNNVNLPKLERNSLTKVLSETLDSMKYRIRTPDTSDGSDFDDTPGSQVMKSSSSNESLLHVVTESTESCSAITVKSKVSTPAVKPKPSKKKSEQSNPTFRKTSAGVDRDSATPPPLPIRVKCHSTSKNSNGDAGDSEVMLNSEVDGKMTPKSSEGRVSPLGPTENGKASAGAAIHSQYEDSFKLPPPMTGVGDKQISFVDLAPPEAFKLDETSVDSIPTLPHFPTEPPQSILEEDHVKAIALCISSPLPSSPSPTKLASASVEVFMFLADEDKESNDRPSPIQISENFNLPSPIPSPVHERYPSSLLSLSPISPPAFEDTESFWINNSSFSCDIQPTLPPFSPQSTSSELSDAPPPLPSEPPPLLDSDASSQFFITMVDVYNSSAEVLSSTGSSPRSYDVAILDLSKGMKGNGDEVQPEMREEVKEMQEVSYLSTSITKVVPEKLPKPNKGFSSPEAEQGPSATVMEPVKSTYKTIPLKEWSVKDVCNWLDDIGLGEHVNKFTENEMMGEHLVDISRDDLKELGLKKLGHQKTFLSRLSQITR